MKLFIKIVVAVVVAFALIIGGFAFFMTRGLDSGKNLPVGHIKASGLASGVYQGTYNGGRWSNEVNVTVKDGKISKIDVVKSVLFERPELTRDLINCVIEKQDTDVDIVSGATVSCKAYLKSIENALSNK